MVSSPIKIYEQYFRSRRVRLFSACCCQGIEKTGTTLAYDLLLINTFIHPQVLVNDAAYTSERGYTEILEQLLMAGAESR